MKTLEEASFPLQTYLDVGVSKDVKDQQVANRLPKPLATLFEKLRSFAEIYPQFRINVKVKGDSEQAADFY